MDYPYRKFKEVGKDMIARNTARDIKRVFREPEKDEFLYPYMLSRPNAYNNIPVPAIVGVNEVYLAVNDTMRKIAPYTGSTQANMLVTLLEAKMVLRTLSIKGLKLMGPLGRIASLYLQYQFGIKPTLADIETIYNLNEKVVASVEKWNRTAGQLRYYHVKVGEENTLDHKQVVTGPGGSASVSSDSLYKVNATIAIIGRRVALPGSVARLRMMGR
jgi:hypothetical protein